MFLDILSDFFSLCPALSGRKIAVNYLAPTPGSVSIEAVSAEPCVKHYTDGGGIFQSVFKLLFRLPFDSEDNFSSLYSDISKWVESVNLSNLHPDLPDGFTPVSLSILKSGGIASCSASSSCFEILCRFVYSD